MTPVDSLRPRLVREICRAARVEVCLHVQPLYNKRAVRSGTDNFEVDLAVAGMGSLVGTVSGDERDAGLGERLIRRTRLGIGP